MLRFSYKKCCSPTVLAYQSHRNFVVSLSRLFLLGFAFFSSFCLLFKRSIRNSLTTSKINRGESHCIADFCGFNGIFHTFLSRIRKSRMFHVKHSAFSCFLPLFFGFLLSFVSPFVFRFFLPYCSARCFSLLFTLFLGRFLPFCTSWVILRCVFCFGVIFALLGWFLACFFLIFWFSFLFSCFCSSRVVFSLLALFSDSSVLFFGALFCSFRFLGDF